MIPEIKIFLYIFFVICLFLTKNLVVYMAILFVIVLLLLRIPFRSLKSGWIPISLFLLFTFISNALFQPGKILFESGPFAITVEGLDIASVRTLRVFFMVAGAKILTSTTEVGLLIRALEKIFKPLERVGLPVHEFFSVMELTMKSLPVLKERMMREYKEKIREGNVRGFLNRARVVSSFLIPLFVKSMQSPEGIFEEEEGHEKGN